MKNYKHYVLGAFALTAALGFTACSSDNSEEVKPGDDVKGFYLQLSFVGNNTTRSDQTGADTDPGKDYESTVKTGTLFLYKGNSVVFRKELTENDWDKNKNTPTTNSIPVAVNSVDANVEYTVYFVANSHAFSNPISDTYTAQQGNVGTFADENAFVMFNQDDNSQDGKQYKVTFTADNKDRNHPATVKNSKGNDDDIKIERVVARIDAPTSEVTVVSAPAKGNTASESQQDAQEKVKSVKYVGYAISNLPLKTNIMQQWNNKTLSIPQLKENEDYNNDYTKFGTSTELGDAAFNTTPELTYVFENIAANDSKLYTRMYFKYQVTLTDKAMEDADCDDGTFYRYDHKIYTSLKAIEKSIDGTTSPLGNSVDNIKNNILKIKDKKITATEKEIADFRKEYNIEVFEGGVCYYNTPVNDETTPTGSYAVLRNTIYKLNVKNVYNVGADVPNGEPEDIKPNYYIQVSVTVNPWILRTYDVELQ